VNDECRDFSVEMKGFLEFLIEVRMKMKMIASGNSLLLTIREINVSLMIAEVIFLIDLEIMILDV
jgi:hypothetical protein